MYPFIQGHDPLSAAIAQLPVGLLCAAPLFLVAGLVAHRSAPALSIWGLVIMALGTAGSFASAYAGEHLAGRGDAAFATGHRELSETCRWVFVALTIAFAGVTLAPVVLRRRLPRAAAAFVQIAFLGLYLSGVILLARVERAADCEAARLGSVTTANLVAEPLVAPRAALTASAAHERPK